MQKKNFSKNNKIASIARLLLFSLIIFWMFLSILRLGYSFFRLLGEERYLFSLSAAEKKQAFFANPDIIDEYITKHLKQEDAIMLYGTDGGLYFRLRYLVYPRKVYWENNIGLYPVKPNWSYKLYTEKNLPSSKNIKLIIDSKTHKIAGGLVKTNE